MLSIVVPWKNRKELKESLASIIKSVESIDGEVIVSNFGGDDTSLEELCKEHRDFLSILNVDANKYSFNKAACNNLGASQAKNDFLFFCDCDIILNPDDIWSLLKKIKEKSNSFGTLKGVKESIINSIKNNNIISFGYQLDIKIRNGRKLRIVDSEEDATDGTRNAPGLLMISKKDFQEINGYNSELHGWGWEDQDMISRLILGLGLQRIQYGKAIHISHNDHERVKHYPIENRWESRDKMFRTALNNYDNDNFSGTLEKDLQSFKLS